MSKSKICPETTSKANAKPKPNKESQSLRDFAEQTLQLTIWPKMEEIFDAVAPEDGTPGSRKILVRSSNGAGKTTALAAICNWYFLTYPDSIVLTTASSWNQVKRNLWGEIRRQARQAKLYTRKKIKMFETKIMLDEKHFMIGISPDVPENAMGFHAPHLLIAVDEATGVNREIMEALLGNLTGTNAQIVLICNPIDRDSFAYEAERSGQWKVIHISALDHPNVTKDKEQILGAVDRSWVRDRLESWSEEISKRSGDFSRAFYVHWLDKWFRKTPLAQARILGEWSQLEAAGFIPLELIERYTLDPKRKLFDADDRPWPPTTLRAMGVDISRGVGEDETVYAFFDVHDDGPDIQREFQHYRTDDLMATAERIKNEYDTHAAQGIELIIAIDDTGIGGGVSDRLKQLHIPFFAVNFGGKPRGFIKKNEVANARAEMYFLLSEEIREGTLWLNDYGYLRLELSSVRLDVSKTTGTYKMEDKELTKQRLGRSPDYADATALARYGRKLHELAKSKKFL